VPGLVKIGPVVLEKKTFKLPHPIFVIISPLKRTSPIFEQTLITFIQGYFVPSLIEFGLLALEKIF
jgi:hypothetical protein